MTKLSKGAVLMYLRRSAKAQTRNDLGIEVKIHASEVSALEAGRRSPGRRLSLDLKRALGVDPEWWDHDPAAPDLAKYERSRKEEREARGRRAA